MSNHACLINKAIVYRHQAIKTKEELEKNKFLLFLLPTRQKKYYIALAVIECINQLLDFHK